jgi:hypothetical protein
MNDETCKSCHIFSECEISDYFFDECPCGKCLVKPICQVACDEWRKYYKECIHYIYVKIKNTAPNHALEGLIKAKVHRMAMIRGFCQTIENACAKLFK